MDKVNIKDWYMGLTAIEKDQVRIELGARFSKTTDCVKAKILGLRNWSFLEWEAAREYFRMNWEIDAQADNVKP